MTGDTTTVLIGLALIIAVLPVGLLVLARAERAIERQHPDRPRPSAELPAPRAATAGAPEIPAQSGRQAADEASRAAAETG